MANVPYDAHAWYEEGERVKGWFGETGDYYNCTIVTRYAPWGYAFIIQIFTCPAI